jgi:phenylacetate-CoA ligase
LPEETNYYINPLVREIIFDGFRLNDAYFDIIYKTIKRFNVSFIHTYPSTAREFSTFLQNNRLDTSPIKAYLAGSEQVFEHQLELMENRLGIRLYNWYGHSEKLILPRYCGKSKLYHVEPTYGYFELVDSEGNVIKEPGKTGEMVGTSFHNPGMPLIRYRTGDYAEYVGPGCPVCGKTVPVIQEIHGRWAGDKIYGADGAFVTTTALNLHSDLYTVINGLQYIQDKKGELDVLVIKGPGYLPRHEKGLYQHFQRRLSAGTKVWIRYVDHLIRQPNGKFLLLVSKVTRQGSGCLVGPTPEWSQ